MFGPKPDRIAPGPEDRAKILASTIPNTEAGTELRWRGTEAVVRKYYLGKYERMPLVDPKIPPVPRTRTRTAVLAG